MDIRIMVYASNYIPASVIMAWESMKTIYWKAVYLLPQTRQTPYEPHNGLVGELSTAG